MSDPVLVVPQRRAALPASGEFIGQLVVLSTTGVIYRWGSALAWVPDGAGGGGVSDGTYGDIVVTSTGTVWTIGPAAVTLAKMANLAAARFIGRVTGTGVPEAMTGTQATTLLDAFTSSLKGLAPPSGGGTTNFLRADGAWVAPTAAASALALSQHVLAADFTVTDAYSATVSRYLEVGAGFTLTIGTGSDMEIT